MDKLAQFVIKFSNSIKFAVVIVTLILGYYATQIKIKSGIEDIFPEVNPVVETFNKVTDLFGGMTYVVVMLEDENILDYSSLQKIDQITKELEKIDVVEEVTSLTNIKDIKGNFFGIEVKNLIEKLPKTEAEIDRLKEDLIKEEEYVGSIISEDFTSSMILVSFEPGIGEAERAVERIKGIVGRYAGPEKMYLAGTPFLANDAGNSMKTDLTRLLPFVLAIVIIILWLSFRSLSGVLLPLITVLISVIWAIGVLSLFGKALSMVSVALPVLLVSVGSAYAIHIVARYYEELEEDYNIEEAVSNTIKKVGIAVLIAGVTTMVGFGSLLFSELVIIKDFALGTAFGVGVALLISVLFLPAIYLHLPRPKRLNDVEKERISNHFFKTIFQLVVKQRPIIIILALTLAIGSIWAIPKIKTETGYLNYFRKSSETRIAAELVDEKFGGSSTLEVVINGDIKDPELLAKMRDFQDEAEKIDGLNNPVSMVTIFKKENKALNGGDDSMNVIPTNTRQIAQYLLLLTLSDDGVTKQFLTFDESKTRIQFRVENMPSEKMEVLIYQVESLIDKYFGGKYEVVLTGLPVMMAEISRMVIKSQIQSIIASVLMTFVITSLLLRSIKRGIFCSVTIALTVLINFGIMGWFGVPLDIATAMIASVAVGIGVDYSIHIYTRYMEEKETHINSVIALNTAIYTVGRANLYNALAVTAGFCVILLSSFPPLINFGGLTAITMVVSFIGAILILPTFILSSIKIVQKVKEIILLTTNNK